LDRVAEGKLVNLKAIEKEDLPQFSEWFNASEVFGEYNSIQQLSRVETEKVL